MYQSTRKQWGARGHGGSPIGEVPEVVGHTEAGAPMSERASVAQEEARMRAIDAFHLSLGWSGGFGYSVAVMPSGRLYEGRGYRRSGAHTQGRNSRALAFVVPGHGDRTPMTPAAIQAIRSWIGAGIFVKAITRDPKISGHRDYSNKSCPGNKIYPQLRLIRGVTGPEDSKVTPPWTSASPPKPVVKEDIMATKEELRAIVMEVTRERANETVRLAQAACAGAVAAIRADVGMDPDARSDMIHVRRIREGEHNGEPYDLVRVREVLERAARYRS